MSDQKMSNQERLKLNEMLKANDVEDQTKNIRKLRHSKKIRQDIEIMQRFRQKYQRLYQTNRTQYENMLSNQCNFLFTNYTDIYNKLKKDELDLTILAKFISVLERIENSEIDQHEGSYLIGKLLKELYIDSAIKKGEAIDKQNKKKENHNSEKVLEPEKKISWKQYKMAEIEK